MTPDAADHVEYLTVDAFRQRYGIGTTLTYQLIAEGKLKAVSLGRRRLIQASSAREYFAALPPAALRTGLHRRRSTTATAEAA